jgi:GPH family glycoside/pentoside/hexuronide:cation symporter
MGALLVSAAVSLLIYTPLSRRFGKRTTYFIGAGYWIVVLASLFLLQPSTPTVLILVIAILLGLGMGISYAIPWAMLPEVVDVDEAVTGQRQEGVYAGIMTFLRQVSSSLAVFSIGAALQFSGYNADLAVQPASAVNAIRLVTTVIPIFLIVLGLLSAWLFPITRENFTLVREYLDKRHRNEPILDAEKHRLQEVVAVVHGAKVEL